MTAEIILRYAHFLGIFLIVGSLSAEMALLKKQMTIRELKKLGKIDGIYGLAALFLLGVGLTLWLGGFGKPTDFYSENPVFHFKLTLFVLLGIISIYPTVFFIKKQKGDLDHIVTIPPLIFWSIRLELILLIIIPILAGLMAKGIGF